MLFNMRRLGRCFKIALTEKCQRLIEILHVQSDADDAPENAKSSVFEGDLAEYLKKTSQYKLLNLKTNNNPVGLASNQHLTFL